MTDAHVGLAGQLTRLPQRQVLSDDVYETVKGLIMDSVVEPGTRLNIDALTRELGISQTPIRESLARLESDGLVIKEPLRGYRVSSTADPGRVRGPLRVPAAHRAVGRRPRRGADRRPRTWSGSRTRCSATPRYRSGRTTTSYKAMAGHDQRFHDLVLELSGNETARQSFARTHCHLHLFRLYYGGGIATKALREHKAVVDRGPQGRPRAGRRRDALAHRSLTGPAAARVRPRMNPL